VRLTEIPTVEFDVLRPAPLTVQVALRDFSFPHPDLVRPDLRAAVRKWSDYIDYWAVDWDYRGEALEHGWVAYRTRRNRALALVSDPHTYERPGKYRILVKVVDALCSESLHDAIINVEDNKMKEDKDG